MLIPLESGGLKGAELDKAAAELWRWEWGMVGEADKRREVEEAGEGESIFCSQCVKGGIMSDVFPASTFRRSHCHQHSSS